MQSHNSSDHRGLPPDRSPGQKWRSDRAATAAAFPRVPLRIIPRMKTPLPGPRLAALWLLFACTGLRAGKTSTPAQDVSAKDEEICALAAAPSGLTVLVGGEDLTLIDVGAEKRVRKFSGTSGTQRAVAFSPDG